MLDYAARNVTKLLDRRQCGLPIKEKCTSVRYSRCNYRCDFEILKSLLCDRHCYLEVIACRKVCQFAEPSFCNDRLFTNNYHSWFNLCTGPTSGPRLLKSNVFTDDLDRSSMAPMCDGIRIVDAVTLEPPHYCLPLSNREHEPCIVMLSKSGWLYQFRLEDAQLVNKIFLPTKFFSIELKQNRNEQCNCTEQKELHSFPKVIFKYRCLTTYGDEGKIIVRSAAVKHRGIFYVAFALLTLFPLRLDSHFVTSTTLSSNFTLELWNDILILSSHKGSTVCLYEFEGIKKSHQLKSFHPKLHCVLWYKNLLGESYSSKVCQSELGFPYTMSPINLDKSDEWKEFLLFQTKALKHMLRVGGIPYLYAVPTDQHYSTWSLRSFANKKEVSRFHVDYKNDNSDLSGFNFHWDDSGKILLLNKGVITVCSIVKIKKSDHKYEMVFDQHHKTVGEVSSTKGSNSERIHANHSCNMRRVNTSCCSHNQTSSSSTCPISTSDFQLCVIDSLYKKDLKENPILRVVKCFEIDISCCSSNEITSVKNADEELSWRYPSVQDHNVICRTSSGRTVRRPENRYNPSGMLNEETPEKSILAGCYDDEVDIIAVLHFKKLLFPQQNYYFPQGRDLFVSLYDNSTGRKVNTVLVEQDCEGEKFSLTLDRDTIVITRMENDSTVNYKIMRFFRKYQ